MPITPLLACGGCAGIGVFFDYVLAGLGVAGLSFLFSISALRGAHFRDGSHAANIVLSLLVAIPCLLGGVLLVFEGGMIPGLTLLVGSVTHMGLAMAAADANRGRRR